MTLTLQATLSPSAEDSDFLAQGIYEEAKKKKGMRPIQRFGFYLKNAQGQTVGGIDGCSFYGSLYIDQLYIEEAYRRQGWARKLMKAAEDFGLAQRCTMFVATTMDWEARDFYEKLGYTQEFFREGYENNSTIYCFRKNNFLRD